MKPGLLTTAEVSRMLKVNDSTIKRWSDSGNLKCIKTLGGHRKYRIQDVVEFMDANNYDTTATIIPSEKKMTPITVSTDYAILAKDYRVLSDMFFNITLKGNREDTFQFLYLLYVNRFSLTDIHDKIIFPAFRTIGEKWMMQELTVDQEHLATNTTVHALHKLQDHITKKPRNGKIALSACLEEEYHELGLMCATNILEADGWTVYSLGANVPVESINNAVDTYAPHLVLISSTAPKTNKQVINAVQAIKTNAAKIGAHVIVGGAVTAVKKIVNRLEADFIPKNMDGLLRYAHSIGTAPPQTHA